ncbi:MAG: hypothetical protein ACRYG7_39480 [Janthinobacterium lividum]
MPDLASGEVLEDYYDPAHEKDDQRLDTADTAQNPALTDLPDWF